MRISKESCAGLVIDIQERLFPHMAQNENLLKKCLILIEGLKILGVPLFVSEQYPRGLGPTLEVISDAIGPVAAIEKATFSCCDEPEYLKSLQDSMRKTLIVCGIEAHVCVLQTVVDLLSSGYTPVVVEDCISSRDIDDKRVAIQRMRAEGAVITTCESILFELTRISGTDEFKAISRLIK
jgi:hypothetical protein